MSVLGIDGQPREAPREFGAPRQACVGDGFDEFPARIEFLDLPTAPVQHEQVARCPHGDPRYFAEVPAYSPGEVVSVDVAGGGSGEVSGVAVRIEAFHQSYACPAVVSGYVETTCSRAARIVDSYEI